MMVAMNVSCAAAQVRKSVVSARGPVPTCETVLIVLIVEAMGLRIVLIVPGSVIQLAKPVMKLVVFQTSVLSAGEKGFLTGVMGFANCVVDQVGLFESLSCAGVCDRKSRQQHPQLRESD